MGLAWLGQPSTKRSASWPAAAVRLGFWACLSVGALGPCAAHAADPPAAVPPGAAEGTVRDDHAPVESRPAPDQPAQGKATAGQGKPAKAGAAHPSVAKPGPGKPAARKGQPVKPAHAPAREPAAVAEPAGEAGAGTSALEDDATRLGPFQAPPRPFAFPLLGEDKARELFVDRAGKLYQERRYSGNIPDWSGEPIAAGSGRCKVEPQSLQWIGFQNNADGSRIYVQLEHQACGYVYRPDDLHIVIDLPQVTVASGNFLREILTGAFPTAVEQVRAEELAGRGTRVVVVLRERRPYLSAHLGKYLFVDVTR